jgi:hypothetical protein
LRADEEARLRGVLARTRSALGALGGVVGTGVGRRQVGGPADDLCIRIFVSLPSDRRAISTAVSALLPEDPFCIIAIGPARPLRI